MFKFITILCAVLSAASAAPTNATAVNKADTVIADGKRVREGTLPDWKFQYHASGYVAKGCPPGTKISTCYTYSLSADPTKNIQTDVDNNTVQNVTFFGPSHPADGRIRQYTFRMMVDPALTSTTLDSSPLVGIETSHIDIRGRPSLSVYLDVRDNMAAIYRFDDSWLPVGKSVPLEEFVGRRTYQTWTLKSGPKGWVDIKIIDEETGEMLVKYKWTGQNSWDNYHMRVGTARIVDEEMKKLKVYWGDWLGKFI